MEEHDPSYLHPDELADMLLDRAEIEAAFGNGLNVAGATELKKAYTEITETLRTRLSKQGRRVIGIVEGQEEEKIGGSEPELWRALEDPAYTQESLLIFDQIGKLQQDLELPDEEPTQESVTEHADLSTCPECDHKLVYPVDWTEASDTHWDVMLRCPDCEWSEWEVHDQATVDRFDEELDIGTGALVRDLRRWVQANMEEEAEVFAKKLEHNVILPEDFEHDDGEPENFRHGFLI